MSFWYNEPKDGEKFASASPQDWNSANSRIEFQELAFLKNDNIYLLFFYATSFPGLVKVGDKTWKFVPQLMQISIQRKDGEKWNSKEKKKTPTPQSTIEKWVSSKLDALEEKKVYTGFLELNNSPVLNGILSGSMPLEATTAIEAQIISIEPIEGEPQLLPINELTLPTKSSWSGSGGGQKESERLSDRYAFFVTEIKRAFPEMLTDNLKEMALAYATNDEVGITVNFLLKVMG